MAISNQQQQTCDYSDNNQSVQETNKEDTKSETKTIVPKVMGSSFDLAMDKLFELIYAFANGVLAIFLVATWLLGFVIAKGFWSTLFCWFPFYAWYLVIDHFAIKYGLL